MILFRVYTHLEHFGLGRYGDPINPLGYELGIKTMCGLLKPGGKFYLSTPIGKEHVEFNANWVFDPRNILRLVISEGLQVEQLTVITSGGIVQNVATEEDSLTKLADQMYNLGIFVFIKN